jgi:hypothetical protein
VTGPITSSEIQAAVKARRGQSALRSFSDELFETILRRLDVDRIEIASGPENPSHVRVVELVDGSRFEVVVREVTT